MEQTNTNYSEGSSSNGNIPVNNGGVIFTRLAQPLDLVTASDPTNLVDFNSSNDVPATTPVNTPFRAVGKAQINNSGGVVSVFFMDEASFGNADSTGLPNITQGINTIDLKSAPEAAPGTSVSDNESLVDVHVLTPDPAATTAEAPSDNEASPVNAPPADLNKYFNFKNFPDGPKLFNAVGETDVDDLNPVNPKPQETMQDGDPFWIPGAFTDPKTGINYYRSDKSVANGDWYAIPINAITHDNETDHLSSSAIDMSKKQKMLNKVGAFAGTPVGLIRDIYFKTKRG